MKRKLSFLFALLLVFCSFGVIGCTSKNDIEGTWAGLGNSDVSYVFFTFNSDGTYSHYYCSSYHNYNKGDEDKVTTGTWTKEKNIIMADYKYLNDDKTHKFEFKDKKLVPIGSSWDTLSKIDISIEAYIENLKNA